MTESQSSQNRKSDKPSWQKSIDLPSERGASRLIMDELLDKLGEHGWASADIFSIHLGACLQGCPVPRVSFVRNYLMLRLF